MEQPVNPITGIPYLADSFVIGNNYDFIDIVCEEHADAFVKENGLKWHGNSSYRDFTDGNGPYAYYRHSSDLGETDYPDSCGECHVYLECNLTRDGIAYVKERGDFPEWLVEALRAE